jgi:hypothetical protein
MGKASRDKGARRERQLIAMHVDLGIKAERVPLSGAVRYQGNGADVDVYVRGSDAPPWIGEVKARASGEGFATIKRWLDDADFLALMEDRAQPLIVLGTLGRAVARTQRTPAMRWTDAEVEGLRQGRADNLSNIKIGELLGRSYRSVSRKAVRLGVGPRATPYVRPDCVNHDWPEELIKRFKVLWAEGLSTAEIGRRLGKTKNAIVGKARRLGLPPRPSPIRPSSQPHRCLPRPVRKEPTLPPIASLQAAPRRAAKPLQVAPVESSKPAGQVLSRTKTCQFIKGEIVPGRTPEFCGNLAIAGKSWCPECCNIVFAQTIRKAA